MNIRNHLFHGLVEAHRNLIDAKADFLAAAGDLLAYTATKTHQDDRVSLPAVFTDADGKTWIIHGVGDGGLTVRPATPYTEGDHP